MHPYRRTPHQPGIAGAYRSAEIGTLSQRDLLVRLYQGIERFLTQAQEAMRLKDAPRAHEHCVRAKAIIVELLSTLDFDRGGEVATQLKGLYLWMLVQIGEANLRKDAEILDRVLPLVAQVRDAWAQVPAEEANTSALAAAGATSAVDLRT
jgi:flagellar secretion chaperone FliS